MNRSHSLIKVFFKILKLLAKISLVIAGINFIFSLFSKRYAEDVENGGYYKWRLGDIYYTQTGKGPAALLIHGLEPDNSSADIEDMKEELSKTNTVYAVDLLGFGNSDAPWITYTNYIYVLLINDFIKDVIKSETCDIVAYEGACLAALQAHKMAKDYNGKVILINPYRGKAFDFSPNAALKIKELFEIPLIGTLLYNVFCLGAGVKINALGKYVFLSRLGGYLATDIIGHEKLIDDECTVVDCAEVKSV